MAYRLTVVAEEQLIECYLYGCQTFGEHQADKYLHDIQRCFTLLSDNPGLVSDNPGLARLRKGYRLPIRIHRHKKHYVVYILDEQSEDIVILSILHEAMDMARHLNTTLGRKCT
jgi:toxin ParE1/3/4